MPPRWSVMRSAFASDWPEDVRQLVPLVARVERDDDGAETRARVLGEKPLGPVREPDRDVLAVDAEGGEATGEPVHGSPDPGEQNAPAPEPHRPARPKRGCE